jgi:glycosyltransferase involved in cell wall biosynthesis
VRILHVIPGIAQRYGGPSEAVLGMSRALLRQGVDALIATTNADGDRQLDVPLGNVVDYRGVPAIFFRRQWSEAFKFSRPLSRWLDGHVTDFDAVHIHAVYSHSSLAAGRACRRRGVPYVVRPLGTLDKWSRRQKPIRKWLMWHLLAHALLRQAAAVQYTSSAEQQEVESAFGLNHGVVIPLSVSEDGLGSAADETRFRLRVPALGERPYVLALCRIHPVKALERLVDAFGQSTDNPAGRDWRLVIAGTGDAAYQRSLESSAPSGRVLFPGWVGGGEKAGALHGAELLALTSEHENFGVSVAEAMLQGVPVLVSRNVDIAQDIESAGAGWVTSLDRANLVQAMTAALCDADERRRRGSAGRKLVQSRFSEAQISGALTRLYRSITTTEEKDVVSRVLS